MTHQPQSPSDRSSRCRGSVSKTWRSRVTQFLAGIGKVIKRKCSSSTGLNCSLVRQKYFHRQPVKALEQRLVLSAFTPSIDAQDGESGSLRDAIQQANSNGEDDVIQLSAGTWNIGITNANIQDNENLTGDFDLSEPHTTVVIEGAGANATLIDANQFDRHFQVLNNVTLILRNLTLTDGLARDNGFPGTLPHERTATGCSILVEGGHVQLENVQVTGNEAMGSPGLIGLDGGRAYGGAIAVFSGSATLHDSTVNNNRAKGAEGNEGPHGSNGIEDAAGAGVDGEGGAGGNAIGGAIYADESNITINSSTISKNNTSGGIGGIGGEGGSGGQGGLAMGGAVYLDTGTWTINDSILDSNFGVGGDSARGGRGGRGGASPAHGVAENGANGGFSEMAGRAQGGGIFLAIGDVAINSTSITNNFAEGGDGQSGGLGGYAGLGNGGTGGNGGGGGEGGPAKGGGVFALRGSIEIVDSTLAYNFNNAGSGGIGGPGGRAGSGDAGGNGGQGGQGGTAGDGQGGAIYTLNVDASIVNSTISTISTQAGMAGPGGGIGGAVSGGAEGRLGSSGSLGASAGGGIWSDDATTANVINTSIAINEATSGDGSGVFNGGSQSFVLRNSLIAGNAAHDDFVGEIQSDSSNNAIGNGSRVSGIQNGSAGNIVGSNEQLLDLQLGALTQNGGVTLTHALNEGSPAIDAGSLHCWINEASCVRCRLPSISVRSKPNAC